MQPIFIAAQHQAVLAEHQLGSFAQIWDKKIAWFEPPNERRGGWSGVGQLNLQTKSGETLSLFVKKQQNHGRKSLAHPFAGEPTFRREFANLQFLAKHNIGAPKLVFYAENADTKQAILITENLADFVPLDTVNMSGLNQTQQQTLIQAVASEIKRFHNTGLVHRALYPKHIFVKNAQSLHNAKPEIALIDLEKARFSPLAWYRAYFDLAAFTRHTTVWTAANKQLFINTYFAKQVLNFVDKWLCNMIARRANRK